MRAAFAEEIETLAGEDERIVLLSGDIGNRMFDTFKEKFVNRFYNCGVAEANMTGMASGMALCGLRPFTYTITAFNTARVLEQIRLDVCYQNLPVTVIGMGAGVIYSTLGSTHHTMEDIAVASAIPNMTVLAPCDPEEMRLATAWCATENTGPVYMRLGKAGEPDLTADAPELFVTVTASLVDYYQYYKNNQDKN